MRPVCSGRPWTTGRASIARCRALSMRCRTDPKGIPTVQVFLAGGVPEVMLHLRRAGLLEPDALTVSGETLGDDARLVGAVRAARALAPASCAIATASIPDDVIMDPDGARRRGLTSTVTLPGGQSRARRVGHQEHVDRPQRGRRGRRVPEDGTGARLPHREGGDGGHQGRRHSGRAMFWC